MKLKLTNQIPKSVINITSSLLLLLSTLSVSLLLAPSTAQAAPTPDSCFNYTPDLPNLGEVTITDYYDNEGNNPSNPACSRDVEIPSSLGGQTVTVIGSSSFYQKNISSVILSSAVIDIDNNAFRDNSLVSIVIPDSVTRIGNNAFDENDLTWLTIGSSVESIGSGAFKRNFQLTGAILIPDSVITIGDEAFSMTNPTSLALGNSVETIGSMVLVGGSVTEIIIPNSVISLSPDAFMMQTIPGGTSYMDVATGSDVNAFFDSVAYLNIITENPNNPLNLQDMVMNESEMTGGDMNGDGDATDIVTGHLINPAHLTISYEDGDGNQLALPRAITGNGLSTYLAKDNPTNNLGLYYRAGDSQSLIAPDVAGYTTPASQTINTLAAGSNSVNFVYASSTSGSSNSSGNSSSSTTPASQDPVNSESNLANTGANTTGLIYLVVTLIIAALSAAGVAYRRRGQAYAVNK